MGELDFLELSVVADIGDAQAKQATLLRHIQSLDLAVEEDQESKTRQVLEYLVHTTVTGPR